MLKEMPKVGDAVKYIASNYSFMTEGKLYEVTEIDRDRFYVRDDVGDTISWDIDFEAYQFAAVGKESAMVSIGALTYESAMASANATVARNKGDYLQTAYHEGRRDALDWAIEVIKKEDVT